MRVHNARTLALLAVMTAATVHPLWACHDGSPLILDLDNDRVRTTGLFFPVHFDIDGDGAKEKIAWTYGGSREAFLWLDLNQNDAVDDGRELFGDATLLPAAEPAEHGFEALAIYDTPDFGGDGDGWINPGDLIWGDLKLWIDENHDGISEPREVLSLGQAQVVAIGLEFTKVDELDGGGNMHRYRGAFVKRVHVLGRPLDQLQIMDDVFFRIAHED